MKSMYMRELTDLFFKENAKYLENNPYTTTVKGQNEKGEPIYHVSCPDQYKDRMEYVLDLIFNNIMRNIDKLLDSLKISFVKTIKPHIAYKTPHIRYYITDKMGRQNLLFSVIIVDDSYILRETINRKKMAEEDNEDPESSLMKGLNLMIDDFDFCSGLYCQVQDIFSSIVSQKVNYTDYIDFMAEEEILDWIHTISKYVKDSSGRLKPKAIKRLKDSVENL